MSKIKQILNNKKIVILCAIILVALLIVLGIIINNKRLTKLEKIKLEEASEKVSDYLEEILLNPDDEGKYISFAIEYLYNEQNKEEFEVEEILSVINDTFDVNYTEEDIFSIGISLQMLEKGIVFDSTSNLFKYKSNKTQVDIANTTIVKYQVKKIKKINKSKFEVTYDKYVVENPYEVLNYYNNYNISRTEDEEKYDTSNIVKYLKGEKKIKVIKDVINEDNIEKVGKIDGSIKITYVIKDNKLKIKK